jgi:hypothetical protein
MATSPLSLAEFAVRSAMPDGDVYALEQAQPGFIAARLEFRTGWIYARLGKRYAWPFVAPAPDTFLGWLTDLVTYDAHVKRSQNPGSEPHYEQMATDAKAEIKEAADSKDGLFDLPLRQDLPGSSGIALGGPLGYSEASPYTWIDRQRDAVRGGGCR